MNTLPAVLKFFHSMCPAHNMSGLCLKSSTEICLSALCIVIISGCHCNTVNTHLTSLCVWTDRIKIYTRVSQWYRSVQNQWLLCTMCCTVTMYHVLYRYYVPCAVPLLCTMCCTVTMYHVLYRYYVHVLYRYYVPCAVPLLCTMCCTVNWVCIFCTQFFFNFFCDPKKNGGYFPKHFPPETHCVRKEKLSSGTFAKSRKAIVSFVMFVLAHWTARLHWRDYHEICTWVCFENLSKKFKFH